jgi:hypothetical protein
MPHDVNGIELKVGDRVTIEFVVKEVHMTEEYCNVRLKSILPMPPYTDQFIDLMAVNTRQTKKI